MLKTHTCGELRQTHCQQEATLAGWVAVRRDHGGLIFLDLRDRFGITQVTVDSAAAPDAHAAANDVRAEYVVRVRGVVQARPAGFENAALDTGDVELAATEVEILNPSLTPPFYIREEADETEETLRLKYRYLDLRRPNMMRNLMLRHELVRFIRNYLSDRAAKLRSCSTIKTPKLSSLARRAKRNASNSWLRSRFAVGSSSKR